MSRDFDRQGTNDDLSSHIENRDFLVHSPSAKFDLYVTGFPPVPEIQESLNFLVICFKRCESNMIYKSDDNLLTNNVDRFIL